MAFRSFFTGAAFRAVSRSVLQCSQRTAVGLGSMTVVSSSARFSAIAPQGVRYLSTVTSQSNQQSYKFGAALGISASLLLGWATTQTFAAAEKNADWNQIKNEILAILENEDYDDGSYAPVLIRLAWHAAGTYDGINTKTGGSNGATMRWAPEAAHGANAGLDVARALLEPIKKRHPEISYADLWTFAGVVAVEAMGGPKVPWRPGRSDAADHRSAPPDGRLPDANRGFDHIRAIFYRMGLNDREIVALLGAHAVGRCHTTRSGFDGPWTNSPTVFTNEFYVQLLTNTWTKRNWKGPTQFEDKDKQLMMLPSDMSLLEDPEFRKYVELYAKDQDQFFKDFASAFSKLLELGVPAFQNFEL